MEKPRPDGGYDLKVSRSTLNKFMNLKKADRVREEAEEMLTRAREAMQLQGKNGPELEAGAKHC